MDDENLRSGRILNDQFLNFINSDTQPGWYRKIIRLLLKNGKVTDCQVAQIVDDIVSGEKASEKEILLQEIPGEGGTGVEVVLSKVYDVEGVNALASSMPLTFGAAGITIVYGDNGSGKSGYARILRRAVGSIDQKADLSILPNAFKNSSQKPSAKVELRVQGVLESWKLGDPPNENLGLVRFYDRECGHLYVSKESEVAYQPYVVTLLIQLSEVCDRVNELIKKKIANIKEANNVELDLKSTGKASEFIQQLSSETDLDKFRAEWEFSEVQSDELSKCFSKITEIEKMDISSKKAALRKFSDSVGGIENNFKELVEFVSPEIREKAFGLVKTLKLARDANNAAARLSFKNEPLKGVGSEVWRQLWDAAERFAATQFLHEDPIPTNIGDRCVLCQQVLFEEGANRLKRFYEFVQDDSAAELHKAIRELGNFRDKLRQVVNGKAALELEIEKTFKESPETISAINSALELGYQVVARLLDVFEISFGEESKVPSEKELRNIFNGLEGIRHLSSAIENLKAIKNNALEEADKLDEELYKSSLVKLKLEFDSLNEKRRISESWQSLEKYVSNLKLIANLEAASKIASTAQISRVKNKLSEEVASEKINKKFADLATKLQVVDYVKMAKAQSKKGRGYLHRPSLVSAEISAEVSQILSEGEQTALGLAGFLTEALYTPGNAALIFDDPVTSMDARRRRYVANLLLDLAAERQIVVFTHDEAFIANFYQQIQVLSNKPEVTFRTIQRRGDVPGEVLNDLPWDKGDTKKRIHDLKVDAERLKKKYADLTDDEYHRRVKELAGRMSKSWERAVTELLVYPVSSPGKLQVQPGLLKIYPKFSDTDLEEFNKGYDFCSTIGDRHDNSIYSNSQSPCIDDVIVEIERIEKWVKKVRSYHNN